MKSVFVREIKLNLKNLIIWSLSVGSLGLVCILLYQSMQGDIKDMADAFSNMGSFSDAFGMSTLSIATLKGYFATEVGTVHGLGSGMFAAIIAIGIISKEEEGHTGEFLLSLPISRNKVVAAKGLCVSIMLIVFTLVCTVFYIVGFKILGDEMPMKEFYTFMLRQHIMNMEIAAICFGMSSLKGKNRMGMGLGIALLCYVYDLMGRVVPDLKDSLFIGPYSYANAAEIFIGSETPVKGLVLAFTVLALMVIFAFWNYNRRDLAA
ncbi:MAG: ABC transporter permease subunit [Lachnospiraceae bacterium]|nr:ABC transporter permease subunit [Lachnospiraceae bacterium]